MTGLIGGIIAALFLGWLANRAQKEARLRSGRRVLEYGRAVRIAGWGFLLLGLFFVYAMAQASEDQAVLAACVGGGMFAAGASLFVEFQLVRIEFDDDAIYTFSPWRGRRVIPWSAVIGYDYSHMNRWHILKTTRHGSIRLSILLSGLGSMAEQLKKTGINI